MIAFVGSPFLLGSLGNQPQFLNAQSVARFSQNVSQNVIEIKHVWVSIGSAFDRTFNMTLSSQKWSEIVKSLSSVWLFAALWTIAHQAPLSMEFSRQEYWSRLPPPGNLPDPGIILLWMPFYTESKICCSISSVLSKALIRRISLKMLSYFCQDFFLNHISLRNVLSWLSKR